MSKVSVILLSGGVGTRMNAIKPKQYLELCGKPIISYSFDFFKSLPNIDEIIVVCDPLYHDFFIEDNEVSIKFALPGKRRQDSLYNGLQEVADEANLVVIHDGARPFLSITFVSEAINQAFVHGASTVAVPLKFTVKEVDNGFIKKTLDRSCLLEVQTPQVIKKDLLKEGFKFVQEHQIEVTDDVSLVECMQKPVKFVMGSYQNIKITTEEDLMLAKIFCEKNDVALL